MQLRIAIKDYHKMCSIAGVSILLFMNIFIPKVSSLPQQNGDSSASDQSIWPTWSQNWGMSSGDKDNPPKETSVLDDVSSNLWNFAEKGLNELKNLTQLPQSLPENFVSGRVISDAVDNFVQIGFPPGQNTTLMEGVSNMVEEIQATKKELENWSIKDAIVQGIKDTAGKIFSPDPQGTDPHHVENNDKFQDSGHNVDDQSQVGENFRVATGTITWIIVLVVLVIVLSVTLALVLTYYFVIGPRRRKTKLKNAKTGATTIIDFQPEAGTQDPLSIQRQGKHLLKNEYVLEP